MNEQSMKACASARERSCVWQKYTTVLAANTRTFDLGCLPPMIQGLDNRRKDTTTSWVVQGF
jgi:hypothetical protein